MDDKSRFNKPYEKLIRGIYLKIVAILAFAGIVAFILRTAFRGKIGNFITDVYCRTNHVSWDEAAQWYFLNVRDKYGYIMVGIVVIFFLIFLRIVVSSFRDYFNDVTRGIYLLTEESNNEPIRLMPELEEVEMELNHVKRELMRRTEEKEQAEKRKDELVVYLAHDIKTPLTSVIGYLDLLEENDNLNEQLTVEQQKRYIHIAREKADRLEKLINEFFEITRSHAQPTPLELVEINLSSMMVQIVDEAYPIIHENQKSVETDIPDDIFIHVDPDKMARVFQNLLKNAINYSDENSKIQIQATKKYSQTTITFQNDGYIPEDKLEHLFDKFYRVDEARQTKTGGSGLGLAIAKEIVMLHKGTLDVYCENQKIIMKLVLPEYI